MIRKMTKYSIIAFTPDVENFLEQLQNLGMMDITRSEKAFDEKSREDLDKIQRYKASITSLKSFSEKNQEVKPVKAYIDDHDEALNTVEAIFSEIHELEFESRELERSADAASVWGEFHENDIKRLNDLGFVPHFYVVADKKYDESWEETFPIKILAELKGSKYFTVLSKQGEKYEFPLFEAKFPEKSEADYRTDVKKAEDTIISDKEKLAGYANEIDSIEKRLDTLSNQSDLYFAYESAEKTAENTLSLFEGFSPTDEEAKVREFLDSSDVVYISESAQSEDNPPIKLKNNLFARIFEPIGDLYTLPKYGELDLTPYFAPFYMLFFGLCLGDMGYGIVLILASLLIMWKMPKMKDYGKLILLLGIGTVIMPALNGTFFGTKLYDFIDFPPAVKDFFFTDLQMFWFAIIFGIFQIVVARIVSGIYLMIHKGWQYGMSNIGWSLVLIWLSLLYAGSQTGTPMAPKWMTYVFGYGGLACILFFSKTQGNIIKRLMGGVTSLYDITGFFGDILSYIRLFGLGCSGGILGMVVNSMGQQMANIPYVGWIICVLFLIFGHTFVLLLSSLGAFVHPLRLTFVEFYKNAGFEGGGKAYKPLKKNK